MPSCGCCCGSLSLLKYFLGGGLGLEDDGFLTKISKDFFSLRGGWSSCVWESGGLCRGVPASGRRDPARPSVLSSRPRGCCCPPRPGLPAGDPDTGLLSLLERVAALGARRCVGAEPSLSPAGRPCQLLSSLLAPAGGAPAR